MLTNECIFRTTRLSDHFHEIDYSMFEGADDIKKYFSFGDRDDTSLENEIIPVIPQFRDLFYVGYDNIIYIKELNTDCLVKTEASLEEESWYELVEEVFEDFIFNYAYDPTAFYWTSTKDGKARPLQTVSFYFEDNADINSVNELISKFFQSLKEQGLIHC